MAKDTGIVNIHGKEYSTVAKRVQDFRTTHKLGYSIETEMVERTDVDVVMKAIIRDITTDNIIATGYAEEKRSSSMINKTSALENCETSAIGRALAAFGLAGTEYASADEVANAINQQNAPKTTKSGLPKLELPVKKNGWKPSSDKPVSDDQKMMIANLLRRNEGVEGSEAISEWLYDNFGALPENEQQAYEVINSLDAK